MEIIVLKERHMKKWGYVIRDEEIDIGEFDESGQCGVKSTIMKVAYTPTGDYIGDTKTAVRLCKRRGIKPELASPNHSVCSIGFCEAEQKWYGWSHRAIFGFGVGSEVKMGDCGYQPVDEKDFIREMISFWTADKIFQYRYNVHFEKEDINEEGKRGFWISWTYGDGISNKSLRGTTSSMFWEFPDSYGRGEWVAETLEDAKQMAIDFASGVS